MPEPLQFDFQHPNSPPPVEPNPDSLADGFLKEVDPQHRPIVEPYVKQWDGNVTKRFQGIHEQYKPYKEIGASPEDLNAAWQIAQAFNENPAGTLKAVFDLYREQGIELQMSDFFGDPEGQQPSESTSPVTPPVAANGLPPEVLEELNTLRGVVQTLAEAELERRSSAENEKNRNEFDTYIKGLHDTHGHFDDMFVASRVANGIPAEQAIKEFNDMLASHANSQRNYSAPPVLGGGGSPGQVQAVDLSKLSDQQRRDYVASRIAGPN